MITLKENNTAYYPGLHVSETWKSQIEFLWESWPLVWKQKITSEFYKDYNTQYSVLQKKW
jgi:hypothetical protein